jgi:hypothetical protein
VVGANKPGAHQAILVRYASRDSIGSRALPGACYSPMARSPTLAKIVEADPPKLLVLKWRNEFKPEFKSKAFRAVRSRSNRLAAL